MIYSIEDARFKDKKRILIDSNIIIAFFDSRHSMHIKVSEKLNTTYIAGAELYYVQPCLLEFKEYWRRKKLTECTELQVAANYRLYRKFDNAFSDFQNINRRRNQLYLNDSQIKDLRSTLENIADGKGLQYWFKLCSASLAGTVTLLEDKLEETNIKYAKFNDNNLFPISQKEFWPQWKTADKIQERFCLSANDAAILNMTNGATGVDAFLSNDGDMLFAVANGALNEEIETFTFLDTTPFKAT